MTQKGNAAAAGGPLFELSGVRRVYGEGSASRAALDGVDLTIDRGTFVAISGPSGSGKSTLLAVLGGLDRAYGGTIKFEGSDLARLPERALAQYRNAKIGFVFQAFHLLPHLSVLDNVMLPSLFAPEGSDFVPAAQKALDRVGLLSRAGDHPQHLSGGQRQRVALARALLRSPDVLLCDEPTGNLDTRTGADVIELLASLSRDDGRTVIVVTHEARLADRASVRIAIVDGKVATGEDVAS
jgi:putative ABC transport system ATP-binding protein